MATVLREGGRDFADMCRVDHIGPAAQESSAYIQPVTSHGAGEVLSPR